MFDAISKGISHIGNQVSNYTQNPGNALMDFAKISSPAGFAGGAVMGGLYDRGAQAVNKVASGTGFTTMPIGGAGQQQQMPIYGQDNYQNYMNRQAATNAGQERYRQNVTNTPEMQNIFSRYQDMQHGYNSQQAQGLRDQMVQGMNQSNQAALRQLRAKQAQMGVGGARSGAQMGQLMNQQAQARANAERDLMVKQYDASRQGLDDWAKFFGQLKSGEMGAGLAEAGLDVADRTGAMQLQMAQAMQNAAGQKSGGLLSNLLGGLF